MQRPLFLLFMQLVGARNSASGHKLPDLLVVPPHKMNSSLPVHHTARPFLVQPAYPSALNMLVSLKAVVGEENRYL
jgi:hypothetical protein